LESYQRVGVAMGILGMLLGLLVVRYGIDPGLGYWISIVSLGIWIIIVSIVGIIIVLVNTKHHQGVGITLVLLGIVGNLLLIIPGIMAYRYKPEGEEIKP
jgi:vacuolar-type H+-ATPase subunit I/STV1